VFAELPDSAIRSMWDRGWMFYTFIGTGGCRFMCSWDTAEVEVRNFLADLKASLSGRTVAAGQKSGTGETFYH